MNLRSVNLNLLTIFDAIMAENNLTRAANKIGMTHTSNEPSTVPIAPQPDSWTVI